VKSSTRKGAQALSGKSRVRRSRSAKSIEPWVGESFCGLLPEISPWGRANDGRPGGRPWAQVPEGKPSSDVTRAMTMNTNAGTALAAGMVPGARTNGGIASIGVTRVIERPE
jgi:hypothetical protein